MSIIDDKKSNFEKATTHLKTECKQIRTGRANPAIVENIFVEYYGTKTPLNQVANITIPDPRSIVVQPWDKSLVKEVEKAIRNSPLGLNPINEGTIIRIPIPMLTEERRKELVKVLHEKVEQARISIRNIREEIWKTIKEKESTGGMSEDDMFRAQKDLQKIVDEQNEVARKIGEEKEKEIMTI